MSVLSHEQREELTCWQNKDVDKIDNDELLEIKPTLEEIFKKLPESISKEEEAREKKERDATIEEIENQGEGEYASEDEDLEEYDDADREFDKQAAEFIITGYARDFVEDLLTYIDGKLGDE